jgi:16S rRNA (cytosine1402-N4)-methyltransferase
MTDELPSKPPRRVRYRGANPRHFQEKYKEHQPDKYEQDVAKVISSGKTPAGTHRPILVQEILDVLAIQPGETVMDCTLGYGGHAQSLLTAVQPGGRLIAIDTDPVELPKAEARLRGLGFPEESLFVKRMNFAGISRFLETAAPTGVDALLADLGLSSMQIDDPARGFSMKEDGPLDMRMHPGHGRSAASLLASVDELELARLLKDHADEPLASTMARGIVEAQRRQPIETTRALATAVRSIMQANSHRTNEAPTEAVRRVFQALRIAVNDELGSLDTFLAQLPHCLKPGGRVAILSFHSGEDRRVKKAFKNGREEGLYSSIAPDIVRPSMDEQRANPRSTSAKLRWAIRSGSADRTSAHE